MRGWTPLFDAVPTAYDLDHDGTDELIVQGNDTQVYVFSAATGRVLSTLPTTLPRHWYVERALNEVTVAVLRPGEAPSLLVADPAAYVAAWRFVPDQSSHDKFVFQKRWEVRADGCHPEPGMDAAAVAADLDGDGTQEVLVQTEETGAYAFTADGQMLWKKCIGGGNAAPVVGDLYGDGRPDVVFASDSGVVTAVDGAHGETEWAFDATASHVWPASVSVSPTVAELDGHPPQEVLFTARNAWSAKPSDAPNEHVAIFAVHGNASAPGKAGLLWMLQPAWANPLSYTPLVVRDVDGDGHPDIFGMDWNTIGHYPGNWERLNATHVFRLDSDGHPVWKRDLETWWSNKNIALADADGDGRPDVIVEGPRYGGDGVWRLSAATGQPEAYMPFAGWQVMRGPLLADLRHDGRMEMVAAVEPVDHPGGPRGALLVIEMQAAYNPLPR
jgi:outer membrane protein assembly factor BamB